MKKNQIIKKLKEDNKNDLKLLKVTKKEYEKLKEEWLNKETEEFELVCQIELRNKIIKEIENSYK